jgi:ATP-dependent 26S proteasome regulatory subunit
MPWSTSNNKVFIAKNFKEVPLLPPGVYKLDDDFYFEFTQQSPTTKDLVYFDESPNREVLEDIESFWANRPRFERFSFPYKRGILMYGPPGCGKSSTLAQISDKIVAKGGYVIIFEDVDEFINGMEILRDQHPDVPVVCVMEDLDSLLQRNNYSRMLNLLDGAYSDIQNVIYLATTNNPEELHANIVNRPSRFDRRIEFGPPGAGARRQYLEAIVKSGDAEGDLDFDIDKVVDVSEGLSFAHLKELFISVVCFGRDMKEVCEDLKTFDAEGKEEEDDDDE